MQLQSHTQENIEHVQGKARVVKAVLSTILGKLNSAPRTPYQVGYWELATEPVCSAMLMLMLPLYMLQFFYFFIMNIYHAQYLRYTILHTFRQSN